MVAPTASRICSYEPCKKLAKTFTCKRCEKGSVLYCSTTCRKDDAKTHRVACQAFREEARASKKAATQKAKASGNAQSDLLSSIGKLPPDKVMHLHAMTGSYNISNDPLPKDARHIGLIDAELSTEGSKPAIVSGESIFLCGNISMKSPSTLILKAKEFRIAKDTEISLEGALWIDCETIYIDGNFTLSVKEIKGLAKQGVKVTYDPELGASILEEPGPAALLEALQVKSVGPAVQEQKAAKPKKRLASTKTSSPTTAQASGSSQALAKAADQKVPCAYSKCNTGKPAAQHHCGSCHGITVYCSKTCKKADKKAHKTVCRSLIFINQFVASTKDPALRLGKAKLTPSNFRRIIGPYDAISRPPSEWPLQDNCAIINANFQIGGSSAPIEITSEKAVFLDKTIQISTTQGEGQPPKRTLFVTAEIIHIMAGAHFKQIDELHLRCNALFFCGPVQFDKSIAGSLQNRKGDGLPVIASKDIGSGSDKLDPSVYEFGKKLSAEIKPPAELAKTLKRIALHDLSGVMSLQDTTGDLLIKGDYNVITNPTTEWDKEKNVEISGVKFQRGEKSDPIIIQSNRVVILANNILISDTVDPSSKILEITAASISLMGDTYIQADQLDLRCEVFMFYGPVKFDENMQGTLTKTPGERPLLVSANGLEPDPSVYKFLEKLGIKASREDIVFLSKKPALTGAKTPAEDPAQQSAPDSPSPYPPLIASGLVSLGLTAAYSFLSKQRNLKVLGAIALIVAVILRVAISYFPKPNTPPEATLA